MENDFQTIFDRVRPMFARYEAKGVVLHDEPHRYYLGSQEVRAKDGYRTWFGGVEIKKGYVSVHLIPLYASPGLADMVGEGLRRRMQGKSCFNLKRPDEALFTELDGLVAAGAARFESEGRL